MGNLVSLQPADMLLTLEGLYERYGLDDKAQAAIEERILEKHSQSLASQETKRLMLEARLSERKEVALDNYQGQTFSDSTNWHGKFDKFIENNERRIAKLEKQMAQMEEK